MKHRYFILLLLLATFCFSPVKAQLPDQFQRVELLDRLTNVVKFNFAPDGRIFILDRYGEVLIYKPSLQTTVSAGTISVFHDLEDGLIGIALDPNFAVNNYVYLQYSPLSTSVNRVSRFTMNGDQLNMGSEVTILEWAVQRNSCCHSGGDMGFDSNGNLYIATGDNTDHGKYAALDEVESINSAEKSSSNTNDYRGKILRITPQANGTYTIPSGNLFPGGNGGLPEIYVMGARNPYRIFVDKENTDWLFWGEVGPDANATGPEGPMGLDEINLTKSAGNFGWPYFSGKNEAYRNDYINPPFYYDPQAPVNLSTWNTGSQNLPAAEPSWLEFFHECYLAGPRYYYDPALTDQQRLPVEFDEAFFYYDFNTSQIWVVKMDANGNILSNEQLAPAVFPEDNNGFIDLQIGPDGHLYILEYGAGCCPDNIGRGRLIRVDYTGDVNNSTPEVNINANPTSGSLPLQVDFSSAGTIDPDGDPLTYSWDFQTDGTIDSNLENPSFTYTTAGEFNAQLRVEDDKGASATANITINAGNNAATFTFNSPLDGGLMSWGDDVNIELVVDDIEDGSTSNGTLDCNDVNLVPSLGHLNHFHDDLTISGCPSTINMNPTSHDIDGEMDIFYVVGTNYTDQGGITAFDQIRLHPKRKEAEFYDSGEGIAKIGNNDPWSGGSEAIRVDHGGYISFEGRNLANISSVKYRATSEITGGIIEFRLGSPSGQLINTAMVPVTGSDDNWVTVEEPFTDPGGKNDLFFVFKSSPGEQDIFDLNYVEFIGEGVSIPITAPVVQSVQALSQNLVQVVYAKTIDKSTAERIENYSINNGVGVNSAFLQPDDKTVILTTTDLNPGILYTLTIADLQNFEFEYADCSSSSYPSQWSKHQVDQLSRRGLHIIPSFDLNGDGLKDIVTGTWWFENPGSASGTWEENIIPAIREVAFIYDFDNDGDYDLLGTRDRLELLWAENNGSGNFTIHDNVPTGTSSRNGHISGIVGGFFQPSGPYQIAITWNFGEDGSSGVQMLTVPTDPVNTPWTIETIHPTSLGEDLSSGDIDGDGDLDLFQGSNWLRNDQTSWSLFSTQVTLATKIDRHELVDVDKDGDLDGVVGQVGINEEFVWLECPADPTQAWTKRTIDPEVDGVLSLKVADMDFDGDQDIVIGEWKGSNQLISYENDLQESGQWIKHVLDNSGSPDHHNGAKVVDIDNDGDLDVVSNGWTDFTPSIYENLAGPPRIACSPVVVNPGNQEYKVNEVVELQIIAGDPNPEDKLTFTGTGLPAGLSIDSETGLISGTVSATPGNYGVTVTVSDGAEDTKMTFNIKVLEGETNLRQVKMYPNPASNEVTIEIDLAQPANFTFVLYDVFGREYGFGSEMLESGVSVRELDLSRLRAGMYYLKVSQSQPSGYKLVVVR